MTSKSKVTMKQSKLIVTIDGPGATGKSSVAWQVSQRLGLAFLNSGSIYRIAAHLAITHDIKSDAVQLARLVNQANIVFKADAFDNQYRILVDEQDVTEIITSDDLGMMASDISKNSTLRAHLIDKQRQFDQGFGLVADGRDMGSLIFPNAEHKFFLTASPRLRAERRFQQLQEKHIDANLEEVYQALLKRDEQDMQRSTAPLVVPKMATVIDTSSMTIAEVVNQIVECCKIQERC